MHPRSFTRRTCLAGAVAAAATAAASSCSGSSGRASSKPTATGKVGGTITYSWWGATERNQKTQAVVNLYEKAHPGVKIQTEATDFSSYFEKRSVEAAGHNLPTVPQMQARELSEYTSRGALLTLDGLTKSKSIDVTGMPKNVLDTGRGADGKLYMVPTGAAYDGIMYNSALATKAAVGALKPGYTWQDWVSWLLRAKAALPRGVYAANLDGGDADVLISYVQSYGQQLFDKSGQLGFSQQMLADYWTMWEKLRKAGATVPAAAAAELGPSAAEDQTYIVQGKAMSQSMPGNQLASAQKLIKGHGGGSLKMTTHPFGPKGIGNVLITSGLSIAGNATNITTAASFINFFTNNTQAAAAFASDNGAVTVTKLLESQEHDMKNPAGVREYLQVYQDIVKAGAPVILYPPGFTSVFEDAFPRAYQNISFGKTSVQAAVSSFFKEAKSDLQK